MTTFLLIPHKIARMGDFSIEEGGSTVRISGRTLAQVWGAVYYYQRMDAGWCTAALVSIASHALVTKITAHRSLLVLVKEGLVEKQGGSVGHSARYRTTDAVKLEVGAGNQQDLSDERERLVI